MTSKSDIEKLQTIINYSFRDEDLLLTALIHSSYGDGRRRVNDNERLEFLGDRVLGLLTAEHLVGQSSFSEGKMARSLNALVRKEACADVARAIGLGDFLQISRAEEKQGGRDKDSILGDACEALIAAIYIDGGLDAVKEFYHSFWHAQIETVFNGPVKDPKTALQEKAASAKLSTPIYKVLDRSGPDHNPAFTIEVSLNGIGKATAIGKSKKEAEKLAAEGLLASWGELA